MSYRSLEPLGLPRQLDSFIHWRRQHRDSWSARDLDWFGGPRALANRKTLSEESGEGVPARASVDCLQRTAENRGNFLKLVSITWVLRQRLGSDHFISRRECLRRFSAFGGPGRFASRNSAF